MTATQGRGNNNSSSNNTSRNTAATATTGDQSLGLLICRAGRNVQFVTL